MKKIFGLLLASTLLLGACGSNENNNKESKTESVNENKTQFKNDTLAIDDAVLKIKDTFLVDDKNSDDKLLAFKYEVKNKTDKDEITSQNVWLATMKAEQHSDNTVNELVVGPTPNTGKFEEWDKHSSDKIIKGKTAKGIVTYSLQNDEDVTLKGTKGIDGKELGTKTIKLDDLKTENYDAASDINNDSADSNNNTDDEQATDDNEQTDNNQSTDGAVASANNNSNEKQQQTKQATNSTDQTTSANTQQAPKPSNNQTNDSQQMSEAEIADWNKNKPTTHDESQMQGVGGHPSAFDSFISKDSQGVRKVDENGDEYYDATGK